mmetsp:Transcript_57810/g.183294  ORF Transcript_57810/g.183294 Transcript_57810/m.183294 type:complete len:218 (+) Transcript_57810:331-984(+)
MPGRLPWQRARRVPAGAAGGVRGGQRRVLGSGERGCAGDVRGWRERVSHLRHLRGRVSRSDGGRGVQLRRYRRVRACRGWALPPRRAMYRHPFRRGRGRRDVRVRRLPQRHGGRWRWRGWMRRGGWVCGRPVPRAGIVRGHPRPWRRLRLRVPGHWLHWRRRWRGGLRAYLPVCEAPLLPGSAVRGPARPRARLPVRPVLSWLRRRWRRRGRVPGHR